LVCRNVRIFPATENKGKFQVKGLGPLKKIFMRAEKDGSVNRPRKRYDSQALRDGILQGCDETKRRV